jgi:hypothetical protein
MNRSLGGIALGRQIDRKVPFHRPIPPWDVDWAVAVAARRFIADLRALVAAALIWSNLSRAGGDAFGYDSRQVRSDGVCGGGIREAAGAEAYRVAAAKVVAVAIQPRPLALRSS